MSNIYDQGLDKVVANSQPLTPINFLNRTADVYPEKIAIIHGKQRITYDAVSYTHLTLPTTPYV